MRWRQFASTAASWLEAGLPVRTLAATPLYSNTTMVAFLPALQAGGTVTIMGKFDCGRWLALAQDHRVTATMLVPVQYQRLMEYPGFDDRSEEHTSELQSLMRISYAVFCLKKKTQHITK